jgi:hypothetical protein
VIQGTLKERAEYHRNHARRSDARQRVFHRKLVLWLKRNDPGALQLLWEQANKKVPNISGRKAKLRTR